MGRMLTWILLGGIWACGFFPAAAQSLPGCATDSVTLGLKRKYPEGVPGKPLPSFAKADYGFSYVVPVVFHIMHDNGLELGVNLQQLQSQIDVLNEDFNRTGLGANSHPDGADVQISFCLATRDPDGNAHTGYEFTHFPAAADLDPYTEDTLMKRMNQWDPARYLNVWVVRSIDGGAIRGYSYFPDDVAGTVWDGLVVDYRYLGRAAGTAISLGRTATHEVGHYLGLLHPWGMIEDACFLEDDGCDDTPAVLKAHFASAPFCTAPFACDGQTPRQVENYMDYSADGCLDMFTKCQADIMRYSMARYRAKLVGLENLGSTACTSVAEDLPVDGGLYLYPNPARNELMVLPASAKDANEMRFRIFDLEGRLQLEDVLPYGPIAPIAIDVSGLAVGLYLLDLNAGGQNWQKKFIIDR